MVLTFFALHPYTLHECNTDLSDPPTDVKRLRLGGFRTVKLCACFYVHMSAHTNMHLEIFSQELWGFPPLS